MPQEHYVLRCFSCGTFQGHIVKKSKKWECKLCGTKQSLKRNYGKGSGKDCRVQVMRLNELRLSKDDCLSQSEDDFSNEIVNNTQDEYQIKELSKDRKPMISKWAEYLDENAADKTSDDDVDDNTADIFVETDEKIKKRGKQMTKNVYSKKRKIYGQINEKEILSKEHEETRDLFSVQRDQDFETFSKWEQSHIPVQTKNNSKCSKYAKYMEKQEEENDLEIKNCPNIFDSDSKDLDSIFK